MLIKLTQNIAKIYKLLVNQLEENIWRHIGCLLVKIKQCPSSLQNTHAFACIQNIAKNKKEYLLVNPLEETYGAT